MAQNNWPVTFSVGVVSFDKVPHDLKHAVKIADTLMYSVKNGDKDNVSYSVWTSD